MYSVCIKRAVGQVAPQALPDNLLKGHSDSFLRRFNPVVGDLVQNFRVSGVSSYIPYSYETTPKWHSFLKIKLATSMAWIKQ
jgi:hypothetical protein